MNNNKEIIKLVIAGLLIAALIAAAIFFIPKLFTSLTQDKEGTTSQEVVIPTPTQDPDTEQITVEDLEEIITTEDSLTVGTTADGDTIFIDTKQPNPEEYTEEEKQSIQQHLADATSQTPEEAEAAAAAKGFVISTSEEVFGMSAEEMRIESAKDPVRHPQLK